MGTLEVAVKITEYSGEGSELKTLENSVLVESVWNNTRLVRVGGRTFSASDLIDAIGRCCKY
jgi:hypothetical protein